MNNETNIANQLSTRLNSYWDTFILNSPKIVVALLILVIFVGISIGVTTIIRKRLLQRANNQLAVRYINRLVRITIIILGLFLALNTLGFKNVAGGLLAGAGVGAVVLGFAFKEIGENFLAGILLLFDSPFRIGDTITSGGNMGRVKMLNFRTTHLKTFDGKDVYVPNSQIINSELYNHTQDGYLRHEFTIGIDYDDDIDQAIKMITQIINQNPNVLKNEQTQVLIDDFGTNTVNLKILFWVDTIDYKLAANLLKTQIMKEVKNALLKSGFGMPANIQEIKMYQSSPIPLELTNEVNLTNN